LRERSISVVSIFEATSLGCYTTPMKKVSTESYKGVRDFYPREQFVQQFITESMAHACELHGFEQYNASVLEHADLYRSKGSDEIVNEQTYTFTDRGEREVTLRPEMTPTVSRMIAHKRRDLSLPVRWYSIPNCFRYERPQRGRLREFWQLNADIFGDASIDAEVEILAVAHTVMRTLGAEESQFVIKINDRRALEDIFTELSVSAEAKRTVMRLLDARKKLDSFDEKLAACLGAERARVFTLKVDQLHTTSHLISLLQKLSEYGVHNVEIDTTIVRGFDYYTGMVFEVYDTDPENNRSLFGGGRYDNIMQLFDMEPVPAVGFGMGDMTAELFIQSHGLAPEYVPACEVMLCLLEPALARNAHSLARMLRDEDIHVAINTSGKKIGEQIKNAVALSIPNIICIGAQEVLNNLYTIKNLATQEERSMSLESLAAHLRGHH
jgi:histidyl-tRNA synthetase